MKFNKKTFITFVLVAIAFGCEDSYNDNVSPDDTDYVTGDPLHPPTALDQWLLNSFTYPYNIEVKYHWDASEGDLYRTLVPPKVSQVRPVMEVVKKLWIDPYAALGGGTFVKTYCPKQFLMVGSARYNPDGSFTLGTAESGRKVVLFVVNEFRTSDRTAVKSLMHIVHHEFGHILNQKAPYPSTFREITPGGYTSDWRFFSLASARANGFITNYAMTSPDEDFVEMVATMLIEGREGYERILSCEASTSSRALLRKKEEAVVQYFRESFDIDFYALQEKVTEAINEITPPGEGPEELPPLLDKWGFDKENKTVRFDLSVLNEPAEFVGRYNQDNMRMHAADLALDYNFKFFFAGPEQLVLRLFYYDVSDEDRVFQQANFFFYPEWRDDGSVYFYAEGADDNGVYIANELGAAALVSYFTDRTFNVDWLQACSGEVYVGFFPKDSPANFCFGMLEN